jgi:iron(III) transport system permease protein
VDARHEAGHDELVRSAAAMAIAEAWRQTRLATALRRLTSTDVIAVAFMLALAGFAVAPLIGLVAIAVRGDPEIWQHLAAYVLPVALTQTVLLLAGVAAVTAITGIGIAWLVTAYRFPGRKVLAWLLPLPLAIPTYLVAYIYADLLDAAGPVQTWLRGAAGWRSPHDYWFPEIRSLGGAIFVMSAVLYPYVYLFARAMFQTQSACLMEVARTLGASRWMLARHVALPLARPALAVGLSLALLETLNDIGASEYLGVQTLTLSIFTTWLNRGSLPAAAQIACVMLLVVAALIALERYGRRNRRFAISERQPRLVIPIQLAGWRSWGTLAVCTVPVALGFLVPGGFLLREVIVRGLLVGFDTDLIRHTVTTIVLAGSATVIAVGLGLGAALAVRLVPRPLMATCLSVAGLGYAVPGTVLALGLLSPLIAIDEGINWLVRSLGGAGVGLVLAGSGAAVVTAYVIRFLTIATGAMQAGLGRISTHVDDAARTLGARTGELVRLIHAPLVRPALGGAALLVFVDCLKELPATLLLRPLNVETLPTYIYQFATRGSFEEGALASLLIVAVGIFPVIWIVRYADFIPAHATRPSPR